MIIDARKLALIILKCLFVLACISILFSVFWLKPLTIEGSRYTMTFIQNIEPFWDGINFRFLLVPFQIPALLAMRYFPEIEPLTVVRLYFYTIYVPIIFCLSYIFLRMKEEKELFIAALIFFVVFLPGMNFQLSHVSETLVIFILSVICAYRSKFYAYIILSLLAILGHPAILLPYILLLFFFSADILHFKKTEFLKYLFVTLTVVVILLIKINITLSHFPNLSGSYLQTILNHLKQITFSRQDFITAGYLLTLSIIMEYIPGPRRLSQIVWSLSTMTLIFFILREKDFELFQQLYQYRVFSISFFCLIMFYVWAVIRLKVRPISSPFAYVFLIILAAWFTVREIRSTLKFWKEVPSLIKSDSKTGCNYTNAKGTFIHTSLPVIKIFLENSRKVESILYSVSYDPERKLCGAITENAFPFQISSKGKIISYPVRSEGFFSIAPMKKKN